MIVRIPFVTVPGSNIANFAGARISAITEEFAANVGVEPGLLVMDVNASSPAADGGLRAGDLITGVNGIDVRDLPALSRALLGKAAERAAMLQVSGRSRSSAGRTVQSGARTVVVRW
jgi:S1-C subfamily serine protease